MKIVYVANDGKEFDSKDKAVEYEATLSNSDLRKKEIMAEIEANNKAIDALKDEIAKILDENDELLEEYKQYLDPETKDRIERVDKLFKMIFGDSHENN